MQIRAVLCGNQLTLMHILFPWSHNNWPVNVLWTAQAGDSISVSCASNHALLKTISRMSNYRARQFVLWSYAKIPSKVSVPLEFSRRHLCSLCYFSVTHQSYKALLALRQHMETGRNIKHVWQIPRKLLYLNSVTRSIKAKSRATLKKSSIITTI